MTDLQIGLSLLVALLTLIAAGLPTAVALLLTAFAGLWLISGDPSSALKMVADQMASLAIDPQLATIPFVLLLSLLITQSNVPREIADTAANLLKQRSNGLAISMVAAHAISTSIGGQSMLATIGFISRAAPKLKRQGYPQPWIGGTLAGASILGIVAPTSLLLVVYAVLSGQSISKQLIAGAIPSMIMAGAFVVLVASLSRGLARAIPASQVQTSSAIDSCALMTLAFAAFVLGGLYSAAITSVEASAFGVLLASLFGLFRKRIDWTGLWRSVMDAVQHSAAIFLLVLAGLLFSKMLASAGIPHAFANGLIAVGLGKWGFFLLYVLFVLTVASLLDTLSLIAIVVPLASPIASRLGFDPLQFGVMTVLAAGCGMLAPPFGIAPFTVKAMLGGNAIALDVIFAYASPYFYATLALLCAVAVMPWLSLALIP